MELRSRDQGTTSLGLKPGKPRDLIGDIQAQQRRKVLRRAAAMAAFAIAVILVAVVVKSVADRRQLENYVTSARDRFSLGTAADLAQAEETLLEALEDYPGNERLTGALALVRAQRVAEYGQGFEAAQEAVDASEGLETYDAELARGLTAIGTGDLDVAQASLERLEQLDDGSSVAPGHDFWLRGQLALAAPERLGGVKAVEAVEAELRERVDSGDADVAAQRLLISLLMSQGKGREALDELERARKQSATHEGLAADEALYNAVLRQKLGGVASVSEQLLAHADELSPPDRAHARLARAVVHLYSGEQDEALAGLDAAWPDLSGGDRVARMLALELAMEAGDAERALEWAKLSSLPDQERKIYEAWASLVAADIMAALEQTAKLPQEHPRVAYIQGLALTEQGRWKEAKPWLERADRMIPGRVDVEVALARVEAHVGDPRIALRKLEGLAKEEPFAPRAWTGLGEANFVLWRSVSKAEARAEEEPAEDPEVPAEEQLDPAQLLRDSEAALARAIEVERVPAEAHLLSGKIWDVRAIDRDNGFQEALERHQAAADTNPQLPRYREALGLYLAYLGHRKQAIEQLSPMVGQRGISSATPLTLVQLSAEQAEALGTPMPAEVAGWLEAAEELGAGETELAKTRSLVELVRATPEDLVAAQTRLEKLTEGDEIDVEAEVLLGRVILRQRESKQALSSVRRAIADVEESRSGRLEAVRGYIELRKGKYPQAAMFARAGFNLMLKEPRPPAELLEAAETAIDAYIKSRKPKPGVGVARDLTERMPYHTDAWTLQAEAELAAKKTSEALESAERAIELDDDNARAHQLIGNAWLRFGKKDRARTAYEKALELVKGTGLESSYRDNLRRL